jgi:hypothetical protein
VGVSATAVAVVAAGAGDGLVAGAERLQPVSKTTATVTDIAIAIAAWCRLTIFLLR